MKNLNQYILLSNKKILSIDNYISLSNERISSIDDYIYISEKLIVNKGKTPVKIYVNCREELDSLIRQRCNIMGTEKHLDLSDVELDESITNLSNLFKDKQIKSIDVCGWNVNNVLNFTNMFCGCDKLKCIDGLIDWEVTSAVNFYKMFYGCALLTEVHGLTDWDVSGITTFGYMFYGCESLELKLNKWKISDGASTYNMTKKSKVSIF